MQSIREKSGAAVELSAKDKDMMTAFCCKLAVLIRTLVSHWASGRRWHERDVRPRQMAGSKAV